QKLTEQLDEILKVPYRVISQKAGVRPTVKDRRPLLGLHPQHPGVYVFNGLGTKGVSLGPFFASHFVNYLEDETDLSEEVNVQRFWTDRKKN
ncbi:MAG: FAD-binding oxidoreductase, partial [Bacteroidia bacterium]|nr:FAD-binding oxidoreductase [Bacteroidia bacterium]